MSYGMTCPKCGLMQLPGPRCKSCGTAMGGPARPVAPPSIHVPRPSPSPPKAMQSPPFQPAPPLAGAEPGESRQLVFHGSGGSLFGIHLVNMFLTVITLGIYYFWAKVKVRRYLLSESEFEGDRFAYHGTGQELLIGFLKALVFFALPLFLLGVFREYLVRIQVLRAVLGLVTYAAVLILIPFAIVGARRYRLSRTSWREIRFSFRGRTQDFIRLFVMGGLLSSITLGLYYPFFDTQRHGYLVSQSYFGNQRFDFNGKGRDLFGSFLLTVFLFFPTLGLIWFWYEAKKQRYFWEHTSFAAARFRSTVTGMRLFLLKAGNLILLIVTLGLAFPWIMVRNVQFAFNYLTLHGPLDLSGIQQDAQATTATGEALAGFLDAGLDIG
jgi:uncharacterized membrane protein YjgN (DUF898 family)